MMKRMILAGIAGMALCGVALPSLAQTAAPTPVETRAFGSDPVLPEPDLSHSVDRTSTVVGWRDGGKPAAPRGFAVEVFADALDYPRWMHVLDNGDVLVSESRTILKEGDEAKPDRSNGVSANRITLLRDADKDGKAEERHVLLDGLNQPFGMLEREGKLYVANTDGVVVFPFKVGETKIEAKGDKIMDLPAGGYNNHWTRNIVEGPGGKLYVTVGSASNVGEHGLVEEEGRAAIHELNADGSGQRIFASGLRNPNGIAFEPTTGALWTAVNERDEIGDDLVPDYITSVRDGGFYGWPFSYWGNTPDPRLEGQGADLVATAIAPDYALGAHTASMSVMFYEDDAFPEAYRGGAFVAQHGSWNRSDFAGYKVLYVPFENGEPKGEPQDFLTGFIADAEKGEVSGRPTGLATLADGSLLVTDDAANTIWRVSASK